MIDPKGIATSYVTSWFVIDVASCVPVQYIEYAMNASGSGANRNIKVLKVIRLFRLAKMLRMLRLKRILARYEEYLSGSIVQTVVLVKMLVVLMFVMHLLACGWYSVGQLDEDTKFAKSTDSARGAKDISSVTKGWVSSSAFTASATLSTKYVRAFFYCAQLGPPTALRCRTPRAVHPFRVPTRGWPWAAATDSPGAP